MRVEEEEKRRLAELQRRRELTETKAAMATNAMRSQVWPLVMEEVIDMATEVAFKVWRRMERSRLKAERADCPAESREVDGDEMEEEGMEEEEGEDEDEEEE
ncbi:Dpy 30 motif [Echinococcus multilocularis]|uniref:Dpy 30 motif n=1 Tax=Echinococcus multilocularis TaxID=6211 RepID=A0A0S4MQ52_ECHMU|nr:Dpy 30 motif [Echinococcus multilocularis]